MLTGSISTRTRTHRRVVREDCSAKGENTVIGKGLFHTHLVVSDLQKSLKFYTGLFGMEKIDFQDGTLVFLTTPGRDDLLALNPGGNCDYPQRSAKQNPPTQRLA